MHTSLSFTRSLECLAKLDGNDKYIASVGIELKALTHKSVGGLEFP